MSKSKKKRKKLKLFMVFVLVALLVWNLISAYAIMVRTVRSVAQSQMEDVANKAIHLAIEKASQSVDCTKLVNINRGADGSIDSLTLNSETANKLKSEIALNVFEYMNNSENYTISVPIGNFFGSEFLSGIGPEVKFRIIPCNIAHIDFDSKFKPAGINQVLHSLVVRVDIDIGALLPGFEEISNLSSSAIISETVIMGDVPQTYLNIQK